MLGKLRRKSKDITLPFATRRPQATGLSPDANQTSRPSNAQCTFLDLPPELRIHIYELIAHDTKLSLFGTLSRTRPPSLLFVTRQVRAEFRPVLLSISPVRVHIIDYQFRPLMRLIGSLYSSELKALRSNPKLEIELHIKSAKGIDKDSIASLRRWAVKRAEHLDRLPWTYELAKPEPALMTLDAATKTIQRHMLSMEAVVSLQKSLHESLAVEIQPIIELLFVHGTWWRNQLIEGIEADHNGPQDEAKTVSLISINGSECHKFALLPVPGFTQAGYTALTTS